MSVVFDIESKVNFMSLESTIEEDYIMQHDDSHLLKSTCLCVSI